MTRIIVLFRSYLSYGIVPLSMDGHDGSLLQATSISMFYTTSMRFIGPLASLPISLIKIGCELQIVKIHSHVVQSRSTAIKPEKAWEKGYLPILLTSIQNAFVEIIYGRFPGSLLGFGVKYAAAGLIDTISSQFESLNLYLFSFLLLLLLQI